MWDVHLTCTHLQHIKIKKHVTKLHVTKLYSVISTVCEMSRYGVCIV